MIFLNLFLAILLENFEVDDGDEEEGSFIDKSLQFLQDYAMRGVDYLKDKIRGWAGKKEDLSNTETNPLNASKPLRLENMGAIQIAPMPMDFDKPPDATQNLHEQNSIRELNPNDDNDGEFQVAPIPGLGRTSNLVAIKELDEDRSPSRFSSDYDNNMEYTRRLGGFSAVNSTVIERFGPNPTNLEEPNNEFTDKESGQGTLTMKGSNI